ncbi:MAG: hypothetical protein LH660_00350 [Phormidesmis sp. CAN_BIN36]|nr:hypothetical protein [Phormidesmis sp. CAN_BIN36]
MNRQIRPHPSPLLLGEGTRLLAPFSLGMRASPHFVRRADHTCIQQHLKFFPDRRSKLAKITDRT